MIKGWLVMKKAPTYHLDPGSEKIKVGNFCSAFQSK
jgi:hypothetical protein